MYYKVVNKNEQCFHSCDISIGARSGNFVWESILTNDRKAVTFTDTDKKVIIIPIENIDYIEVRQ